MHFRHFSAPFGVFRLGGRRPRPIFFGGAAAPPAPPVPTPLQLPAIRSQCNLANSFWKGKCPTCTVIPHVEHCIRYCTRSCKKTSRVGSHSNTSATILWPTSPRARSSSTTTRVGLLLWLVQWLEGRGCANKVTLYSIK